MDECMTELNAGRELDVLVAEKVMGWHKFIDHSYKEHNVMWYGIENKYACYQDMVEDCGSSKGWHPSTDIEDAWKVVEKISNENKQTRIAVIGNNSSWTCIVNIGGSQNPSESVCEVADTAACAICLAALKAVTQEVSHG